MSGHPMIAWLCLIGVVLLCVVTTTASAAPITTTLELVNKAGEPETRAGAHPDRLLQSFEFAESTEFPKDVLIDLPPGLVGDPAAVSLCPRAQINVVSGSCPPESQVGVLRRGAESIPVYSVEPAPNEVAAFAAKAPAAPTALMFSGQLRSEDQGLTLRLADLERSHLFEGKTKLTEGEIELWGIPADHQQGTSIPRRALLSNPTRCDAPPLAATVSMHTWEQPDLWSSSTASTGQQMVGCGELRFEPDLHFSLDNPRADSPSGARIDISVAQDADPEGRATAQIRNLSVTMPAGMTISPGGARGLGQCTDAQLGAGTAAAPACPASSRVGSVELSSAALGAPALGAIYLGDPRPGDRLRFFVAARIHGSELRFAASLQADPATGRLTTTLKDLPQASFDRMSLRFDGGPDALLATPLTCGAAPTSASFLPYSGGPPVTWTGAVAIAGSGGGACAGPPPFDPTFSGGSTSSRAAHATSFTATIRRRDGEQLPDRLAFSLPSGMSAALGTVENCSGAEVAAAACPPSSRIGEAVAELGPGVDPARIEGDIFITGPYRRAPFGVALAFKTAIGPLQLGTLVVRGPLRVDPASGRVTVQMDSLPTIFEGIPVRFQALGLDLDRPGFLHNPTACVPGRVSATMRSAEGAVATPSTPFAIRGCVGLPFRPGFAVKMSGGDGELRREGKPGLQISMRVPSGSANLRSADIHFPKIIKFAAAGLTEICARGAAAEGNCPEGSRVGTASARTSLLERPMKGWVYIVQPAGDGPPNLAVGLVGHGLHVGLEGRTAVRKGQAEARFVHLPDFPLSSLSMRLAGGKHGLLQLKGSPCTPLVAPAEMAAQNGAEARIRARVAVTGACGRHG